MILVVSHHKKYSAKCKVTTIMTYPNHLFSLLKIYQLGHMFIYYHYVPLEGAICCYGSRQYVASSH